MQDYIFSFKRSGNWISNSFNIQDDGKDDSVVLKYEPVQYSTLKNEPQVHFSTGSFFNVTPAARGGHDRAGMARGGHDRHSIVGLSQ